MGRGADEAEEWGTATSQQPMKMKTTAGTFTSSALGVQEALSHIFPLLFLCPPQFLETGVVVPVP